METSPANAFLQRWNSLSHDRRVRVFFEPISDYRIELHSIEVDASARRQGLGTATLNMITALADEVDVVIVLYPEPSAIDRLLPYYERFGFVSMDGGNSMVYEP